MGTTGGKGLAKLVRSSNPRHYSRADRVFALGFLFVVVGAFGVFWTENATVAMVALVSMSFGFCVMVLCMGFEDVFGDKEVGKVKKREGAEVGDGFEGGDAFEDSGGPHRRRKGPKGRM